MTIIRPVSRSPLFPYTTLFRSDVVRPYRAQGDTTRRHPPPKCRGHEGVKRSPSAATDRGARHRRGRSEEHTSELQSPCNLVCRLLLEKRKNNQACPVMPYRIHY